MKTFKVTKMGNLFYVFNEQYLFVSELSSISARKSAVDEMRKLRLKVKFQDI